MGYFAIKISIGVSEQNERKKMENTQNAFDFEVGLEAKNS